MPGWVALLRAVNVGGSPPVPMAALRERLTREGYEEVRTLLQSGNVVLRTPPERAADLERRLEATLSRGLGITTDVFVRSASDWHEILLGNPFPREAERDPSHLVVTVLRGSPTAKAWGSLASSWEGPERIRGEGRHAYIVYPDGIGRSKLTLGRIERSLGTRGTARNWNTVQKLDEMVTGGRDEIER